MEKLGKFIALNSYQNMSKTAIKTSKGHFIKIAQMQDSFVKAAKQNPIKSILSRIKSLV